MIELLLPHLEKGDIIIDGGNSLFTDSNAARRIWPQGILFIGTGVSVGEEGARRVLRSCQAQSAAWRM